ncbi:MAG: response regulator transcription factor [bacterium]|nr:response regulator transcription factor [bacterium]
MSRIGIVIIEDEFFVGNQLKDLVLDLGFDVVGVYPSAEQFLNTTNWEFDAALVDIFLSDTLTGLDVGEHLSKRNIPFVFITANRDELTLKEAARLQPAGYITKPFQRFDVVAALEKIRLSQQKAISIRTKNGLVDMAPGDIYYIKGDGAYIEIYTHKGKTVQRKLLKEIAEELPDQDFLRVHRSYLINRNFVESRRNGEVMVNGVSIPVSRRYKDAL